MRKILAFAIAAASLTGCASAFIHIEKTSDRPSMLTRVDAGFWSPSGSLYECTAVTSAKMRCKKLGGP